jgi:hypothetical protein
MTGRRAGPKENTMLTGARRRWGVAALVLATGGGQASAQQAPAAPAALLSPEAAKGSGPILTSYRPVGAAAANAAPPPRPGGQLPPPMLEIVPAPGAAPAPPAPGVPLLVPAQPPPGHEVPGGVPGGALPPGVHEGPLPPGAAGPGPATPRSFGERFCYWLQDCFLGFPEFFHEPPLGHSVYAHYKTHVANGDAARMVLYRYDFLDGCGGLNPRGKERLAEIAAMLPKNFCPVVIEPGCEPGLDQARRMAVLTELGQCPFPIPPQRVVVGKPLAYGMSGPEAAYIYQNLLLQTQRQGVVGGLGGGSIGGTVGQGFSASGRSGATTGTPGGP